MNNCGIFFENDFKYVAEGDSFIIHYTFFIIHWQAPPARQTGIGSGFMKCRGHVCWGYSTSFAVLSAPDSADTHTVL